MLNQTRRALEDFDNQHDFERLAADVLNALGYSNVEPMAPGGGADGGQDIRFMEGDTPGVAFVTLDQEIRRKFKLDLEKQEEDEGVIVLFCNVSVTPAMKLGFAKAAITKRYRMEVFDLERLRSLLDSSLKDVRRRYLHIDDEVTTRLRLEVTKLLRFPDSVQDVTAPPTLIEKILASKLPRRLFDLLMRYEEKDVREVPGIGAALHDHLMAYYRFRQATLRIEDDLISTIGQMVPVRFRKGWQIHYKYVIMRFCGMSKDAVIARGDFLNYGITWDAAERLFAELSGNEPVSAGVVELFHLHKQLTQGVSQLTGGE